MIDREAKITLARELFLSGYNCAQAVAGAFAEETGIPQKDIFRMVSGLGGGVGGMRLTCGALTGMAFIAGTLLGYDESDMLPEKRTLYALIQSMGTRFSEAFGGVSCLELLTANKAYFSSIPAERTPQYYRTRPCARFVEGAAGFLADMLNEEWVR